MDVIFFFIGFVVWGGFIDYYVDGWGIVFFEDKVCCFFIDYQVLVMLLIVEMVKCYLIKFKNMIVYICKVMQGYILFENSYFFMCELWGWYWIFVYNGDLQDYVLDMDGSVYYLVGMIDSEQVFCVLMQGLCEVFFGVQLLLLELFEWVGELMCGIIDYGVFNFLMLNGQVFFVYCLMWLYYFVWCWLFLIVYFVDEDLLIDFVKYMMFEDCVVVIVIQLFIDNEVWIVFELGELIMFQCGDVVVWMQILVFECVFEKLCNLLFDVLVFVLCVVVCEVFVIVVDGDFDDVIDF